MEKTSFSKIILSKKAYWLSFIIPAAILFAAYALFGMYPFGVKSVLALDLNAQYVSFFDYMYDVFGGKESLFYTWSASLSGEFFGTFAYYLASPFNFIVWLFPREIITEGIMTMLLVKSGAAALAAAFYLKKHRGFSDYTTILFSVMFALCGYFVAHTINPMWLDGLITLPLVIMGVERICQKKGFLLYTLSILYIFIANYYIGYMVGIFSALYILYYAFSRKIGTVSDYFRAAGIYAASSVSAILMSCWLIIPAFKSLQNGKLGRASALFSTENLKENFNIADSFIKLFPGTYDTEKPDGLPMLYCGTLALIFVLIYFMCRKIPVRQKIASGFLLGFMTLSMYIKILDMLWHGGQVPVWMPFRYSFTIIFLLIIFGAEAFEKIENIRPKQIGTAFLILLGVLLICDFYKGGEHFDTTLIIVVPLVVLGIVSAVVCAYRKKNGSLAMKITLCAVVCAELLVNAGMNVFSIHSDVYYSDRSSYVNDIPATRDVVNQVKAQDGDFYRLEKTYHRTVNDPIAAGIYGFSHSTSTFNQKALTLLENLGFGSRDHYSRYDGATLLTDDIFGVKYVLAKDERTAQYDEEIPVNSDEIHVYKNADALPVAFLADESIIGCGLSGSSPFMFQQRFASKLVGREYYDAIEFFTKIDDVVFDSKNVTIGSTSDGYYSYKKRFDSDDAYVSYIAKMPKAGAAYAYFPSRYERECGLSLNGSYLKNYFKNENYCIVYLGDYEKDDEIKVELKALEGEMFIKDAEFYVLDREVLSEFTKSLAEQDCEVRRTSGNSLEIKVNCDESRALFTSIPVEEGWSATLDGNPCTIASSFNDTLLCINVPAGEHTITLNYFPAGMKTGLIFTAAGAGILLVMIVTSVVVKHIKKKKALAADGENVDNNGEETTENAEKTTENAPENEEDAPVIAEEKSDAETSSILDFPEMPDLPDDEDYGIVLDDVDFEEKVAENLKKLEEKRAAETAPEVGELPVIPEDNFDEEDG